MTHYVMTKRNTRDECHTYGFRYCTGTATSAILCHVLNFPQHHKENLLVEYRKYLQIHL